MEKNAAGEVTSYTKDDITNLIVGLLLFSGGNNNQGLSKIKGKTYGEQAKNIVDSFNSTNLEKNPLLKFIDKLPSE